MGQQQQEQQGGDVGDKGQQRPSTVLVVSTVMNLPFTFDVVASVWLLIKAGSRLGVGSLQRLLDHHRHTWQAGHREASNDGQQALHRYYQTHQLHQHQHQHNYELPIAVCVA